MGQTHFITKLALCKVAGSPVTSHQPPVASCCALRPVSSRLFSHFPSYLLPPSHTHRRYLPPNAHLLQVSYHVLSFAPFPDCTLLFLSFSTNTTFQVSHHFVTLSSPYTQTHTHTPTPNSERKCGWDERLPDSKQVLVSTRESFVSFRLDLG